MRLSVTIFLSALAIAATSPTLPPRSCTTIYPSDLQSLISAFPDTGFFNQAPPVVVGGVGGMTVQQDNSDESNPQVNLQFVDFQVPPNSYGCQLQITDQGKELWYELNGSTDALPPTLNVISLLPNAVTGDPTYDNVMNANPSVISSHNFGTFTLAKGASAVINSVECPNATEDYGYGHAQYVFEFAQPSGPGYSDWVLPQTVPDAAGVEVLNGIYMTYNC